MSVLDRLERFRHLPTCLCGVCRPRAIDDDADPAPGRDPSLAIKRDADLPTGIARVDGGYRTTVRIAGQPLKTKRWSPETPLKTMENWRKLHQASAHFGLPVQSATPVNATFGTKAAKYLTLKVEMPTYSDRAYRIRQWVSVFAARNPATITDLEIREALVAFGKHGGREGGPLSHGSLNLLRTALFDFYTVMYGKNGANPVRGVPRYPEEELPLRLPTIEDARAAVAAVGFGRDECKTRVRLRVLLETGWPSSILKRLTPGDIHWAKRTATCTSRKKGQGTTTRTVPLTDTAFDALQEFDVLAAYGKFSGSSVHSAWHRGCVRAGIPKCRVYDLRHLWITTVVSASTDERGAAELALHSDASQIRRYSRQAASARAISALTTAFPPARRRA